MVEEFLIELGIPYEKDGNTFELHEVGGQITDHKDFTSFIHGNREIRINHTHPDFKKLLVAYNEGFDEFETYLMNL